MQAPWDSQTSSWRRRTSRNCQHRPLCPYSSRIHDSSNPWLASQMHPGTSARWRSSQGTCSNRLRLRKRAAGPLFWFAMQRLEQEEVEPAPAAAKQNAPAVLQPWCWSDYSCRLRKSRSDLVGSAVEFDQIHETIFPETQIPETMLMMTLDRETEWNLSFRNLDLSFRNIQVWVSGKLNLSFRNLDLRVRKFGSECQEN